MIKILHLTTGLGGSGVSNLLYQYYKNFSNDKDIQFDFCSIESQSEQPFEEKFKSLGCHINYMPKKYWKRVPYLYRLMTKGNYDIVHSHIELASAVYLFIAYFVGIKVRIAHAHMAFCDYSHLHHIILRYILNKISNVKLGCSQDAIATLFGKHMESQTIVMRNAIDISQFCYSEIIRKKYREKFNLSDKCVIGFAGRFTYQKNIFFLLDIFETYHKRNKNSVLLMLGNGELEEEFFHVAKNKGMLDYILHLGNRSDVNCFMQAMDCLILPSRWEGLGIVLIESQAASLPTVTCKETVPYNDTNITPYIKYCSINDSTDKWCDTIEELLLLSRCNSSDLIKKANYDITSESLKLELLYKRLCYAQ